MITKETIKEILSLAVHAPSGDNAQPWKFLVQNETIQIFNIPEKDKSLYNFLQRGSFVAHGALIENILIIGRTKGYDIFVNLFPNRENSNLTATLVLKELSPKKDSLYEDISLRVTNRKPYQKIPLNPNHKEEIMHTIQEIGIGDMHIIEDSSQKKDVAEFLSINERLLLENQMIHKILFSNIRWTEQEELSKKCGLYLETLELTPPQKFMFRIFKNWWLVQILNRFGLSKFLEKQGAKLNNASSAIGIITMPNDSLEYFIATGRILQRVWLKATKLGLCLQPITAVPYLAQRIFSGDTESLAPLHMKSIKDAYEKIQKMLGTSQLITMIFRIGYNGKPSARSLRSDLDITFI